MTAVTSARIRRPSASCDQHPVGMTGRRCQPPAELKRPAFVVFPGSQSTTTCFQDDEYTSRSQAGVVFRVGRPALLADPVAWGRRALGRNISLLLAHPDYSPRTLYRSGVQGLF